VHCRHITHSPALRTCADGVREHSLLDILQAVLTPTPDAVGTWGDGGGGDRGGGGGGEKKGGGGVKHGGGSGG
jgi:hypothetical protein